MADVSAEELCRLARETGLLTSDQLETILNELPAHAVTAAAVVARAVERGALTNWQGARLIEGERAGYFLGEFKLLYLTDTDALSRTYRARSKATGRDVTLKILRSRYSSDPSAKIAFTGVGRRLSRDEGRFFVVTLDPAAN